MRGNAALLEDLLTWLTEAHALLTAKEKDPIPDDLTVVEVLVKEHLVRLFFVLQIRFPRDFLYPLLTLK